MNAVFEGEIHQFAVEASVTERMVGAWRKRPPPDILQACFTCQSSVTGQSAAGLP